MTTSKIVKKIYKNGQEYLIFGSGGASIEVDSALSDVSENPVQNKVVKGAVDAKLTTPSGGSVGDVIKKTASGTEWGQVSGLPSGGSEGQVIKKTANGAEWADDEGIQSSNNTYDNIVHLSQSEYDNLQNPDPDTLYSTPDGESGGGFNPENEGTTGQVLTKTATGYAYEDLPGGLDAGIVASLTRWLNHEPLSSRSGAVSATIDVPEGANFILRGCNRQGMSPNEGYQTGIVSIKWLKDTGKTVCFYGGGDYTTIFVSVRYNSSNNKLVFSQGRGSYNECLGFWDIY